jgi:hypothetical protein
MIRPITKVAVASIACLRSEARADSPGYERGGEVERGSAEKEAGDVPEERHDGLRMRRAPEFPREPPSQRMETTRPFQNWLSAQDSNLKPIA